MIQYRFWSKVNINSGCWEWLASINGRGYGQFYVCGKMVRAHRFAYESLEGEIPPHYFLDHICQNKKCVNPQHLRMATINDNNRYCPKRVDNTSGYKGVTWHKKTKKWCAKIKVNNREVALGYYDFPEDAYSAYCEAAKKYHGEFSNFG